MATGDDTGTQPGNTLPIRNNTKSESFDIVKTYHRLLSEDPELTMPVAAIEALIELLNQSQASTVFETMDLVKTSSDTLRAAIPNHVPLTHGTELFQQYLVSSLKQPGTDDSGTHSNFEITRQHLLRNGRLFASRAKAAREKIASYGRKYIRDDCTVLSHGGSRVVGTLLSRAAEGGSKSFRVIYVVDAARPEEGNRVVAELRAKGVPVAVVSPEAVGHVMTKVDMVFVGAEAGLMNGGIISRMGTYSIALIAKEFGKPFFVATETHKFGKTFPLGQFDLGFKQDILDFRTGNEKEEGPLVDPVDYTPHKLITSYITENGARTPSAICKELIDFWA